MHKINHADIKEWAANYQGEPFDAILCDPPYELGFMGKSWDSSGIAFDKDMWTDLLRILKPGGHLLAFSGSRTYHRMAVAIEDAGFEIRDMIEWVYGSGFPKSLNVGKAIEGQLTIGSSNVKDIKKLKGETVEVDDGMNHSAVGAGYRDKVYTKTKTTVDYQTEQGAQYQGYGTALKPAHEPCVLARKPIEGTVANNVLKHGTGGLNIDGTRVEYTDGTTPEQIKRKYTGNNEGNDSVTGNFGVKDIKMTSNSTLQGRFPANLVHDGSDEVEAVFPQTSASKAANRGIQQRHDVSSPETARPKAGTDTVRGHNDNGGSASRFFYTAKASKSERNAGLEGFEVKQTQGGGGGIGNYKDDVNSASGKFGSEKAPATNAHPTVKPLSLTKYLATLIKPPIGGRLLVPFSGSGSEMIGALQAGWEYVEGVELTEEYIPIAEARIKYWLNQKEEEFKQVALV